MVRSTFAMRLSDDAKLLAVYSGAATAALLFAGWAALSRPRKAAFREIDVQRINVVEPDGTLRLVLSGKARFPGLIFRGKERPHPRDTAGMLFFNDQGTENGGLIFGGRRGPDGKASSGGSLTFDQFEQDQVVQLMQNESDGRRTAGLKVNDAPETPLDLDMLLGLDKLGSAAREAEIERLRKEGSLLRQRVFVGKTADRSARVVLRDTQERERLVLEVAPDGSPSVKLLDEDGKVLSRLPPR